MKAAHDEEERILFEELADLPSNSKSAGPLVNKNKSKNNEKQMETVAIVQAISKIGALLALGFGEAGS